MSGKIIKLSAENVMGVKAVEISPDGAVIVIGGKNGQGKSSVLNSIMMALGGKKAIPRKPIRDGEKKAEIMVELDEVNVYLRFTNDGKPYLRVTS